MERPSSLKNRYILLGTLNGHRGAILCLAATDDGKILASGGTDGVKLWMLPSMRAIENPSHAGLRGGTTALVWTRCEDEADEILFYGTQNGFLVCWKQHHHSGPFEELHCIQLANPSEITGLSFDTTSNHLVVCNRNSLIQLFTIDGLMMPRIVFSITIDDFFPKAIAFGHMCGDMRAVLAFGLYDGQVHTLRGNDGKIEHTKSIGGWIGDAAVNARKGVFCIDEPTQGVALYRLETGARIRTFPIPVTKSRRARQVSFAEDCSIIVSGSDHGIVYVFDRRSGETLDELQIDLSDWVQTVLATDINSESTILAAKSSNLSGNNPIFVWKKSPDKQIQRRVKKRSRTLDSMTVTVQVLMLLASVAFVYQNLEPILRFLCATYLTRLWKALENLTRIWRIVQFVQINWGTG